MKYKHIHFVGIKGVGMTPLALIAKEAGIKVTGSDIFDDFITGPFLKKSGIIPFVGFSEKNIDGSDLVIMTGAHGGFDNVEIKRAKEKNIPVLTQGEAVGVFMNGEIINKRFVGISVAGCHGKTTTTAMIATILKHNNLDPSYVIGTGEIPSLGAPGHFGRGKYFVAEADEYATEPNYDNTPKFLWQHPKIAVITNIELDHPDLYKSENEVINAYRKFADQLGINGTLVVNGDDRQIQKLLTRYMGKVITYGFSLNNKYVIKKVTISQEQTFFWVETDSTLLGEFCLNVVGEYNVLNALASVVVSFECGLALDSIKKGLTKFIGSKRRFEYIGRLSSGALLFDDYAHHPTEIRETLKAFHKAFPKYRIVCIFQPHTYSRTKIMFEQFIHSFNDTDEVIITNIYPSLREQPDPNISSKLLVEGISRFHKNTIFLAEPADVIKYVNEKNYKGDTIVLTMGAGDIYKINSKFKILASTRLAKRVRRSGQNSKL